jgi:hypothetical protein
MSAFNNAPPVCDDDGDDESVCVGDLEEGLTFGVGALVG